MQRSMRPFAGKPLAGVLGRAIGRFYSDTSGTLVIFGLLLLMLMVMMGGIAVDLMRYETARTTLQNTLDRSTLAAASLSQSQDPTAVVNDYFLKAGIAEYLTSVTVDQGLNFREVTANAVAQTDPIFLHLIGVDTLDAPGHSQAMQRVDNVEIVLALDISGSMDGAKITNLRLAAASFVDTVLDSDPDQKISIAIVPYNAQVNLPDVLVPEFNVTYNNNLSNHNCLELPASVFLTPEISRTLALPMMAYADTVSSTSKVTSWVAPSTEAPVPTQAYCRLSTMNQIMLPSKNKVNLTTKIESLTAGGNTSIMYGMRWALALLDPDAQPIFTHLIASNNLDANLADHPLDYSDTETLKVIVLMTDGEHTQHEGIANAYKTGLSPIYKSLGDGNYSIRHTSGRPVAAGANEYWVPHLGTWQATAWNSGGGVTQQDWRDIWPVMRSAWVEWQLYARALGTDSTTRTNIYNSQQAAMELNYGSTTTMNTQLQQVCGVAKNNGVVVYGIAFEAPTNGQTQIRSCSTSDAHYFNATGLQISTAFDAIANNISQLRLTQ
jgi:Flp pilus assembly protein TadG